MEDRTLLAGNVFAEFDGSIETAGALETVPVHTNGLEFVEDATLTGGFTETVAASGLSGATAMQFSPDGKLFIAEEAGTLEVWENNVRLQANFFVNNPLTTQTFSERGLLGLAFDPDYPTNRFVYVYYTTTAADNHNRVSRFTADAAGELALAGSEHIIMELDAHSAGNHNGGAMHFGIDGMLYIAVGDDADGTNPIGHNSQSLDNRHGKMLRIDVTGDDFADPGQNYRIPAGNPTTFPGIAGSTSGFNQSIWAVGLRNPFTFSVQPGTGRIFINDVGQNTWEEINDGVAGLNYGWPGTEGGFNQTSFPNFTQPFYAYDHTGNQPNGCAITGGAFYNPAFSQFPAEYQGDYFFADFCGDRIWHVDLTTKQVNEFASSINAPVDLKVDDDGNLFYLSRGDGQVLRISFTGQAPSILGTQINGMASPNRSGIDELMFTFDQNVTVSAATSLNLFNHTTSQSIDLSAATLSGNGTPAVAWQLTGVALPDGRYTAELPAESSVNDAGVPLAHSHAVEFHVKRGDVSGDGRVNATDFIVVDANFDPLPGTPFRAGDGNGDGRVNASDFIVVDANFNPLLLAPLAYDFGDAPETGTSFPTTLPDGARHVITGNTLFLGADRDAEADGQPNADATGDGADENGISVGDLVVGTNVAVTVTSNGAGFLNGWVDFNQDGDWDDPGEQVFTDQAVVNGVNNLQIAVPGGATPGSTFARFRLTGTAGYSYDGLASSGEVEDYQVTITASTGAVLVLTEVDIANNIFEITNIGNSTFNGTLLEWCRPFDYGVMESGGFSFAPGETRTYSTGAFSLGDPDDFWIYLDRTGPFNDESKVITGVVWGSNQSGFGRVNEVVTETAGAAWAVNTDFVDTSALGAGQTIQLLMSATTANTSAAWTVGAANLGVFPPPAPVADPPPDTLMVASPASPLTSLPAWWITPQHPHNFNAFVERLFRSLKSEALDRLIIFGEPSLRGAVVE